MAIHSLDPGIRRDNMISLHANRGTKLKLLTLCASLLLLAGCSPHPGSGIWAADSDNAPGFTKIDVQFNGRADIYNASEEKAVRRCFWGGMSSRQITLDCVQAANTDIKEQYRLTVTQDDSAELSSDQQLLGTFAKQPRSE
ncbi:MAG: hypothetical protein ABFR19_06180 [Pseudomonadota bacterium]